MQPELLRRKVESLERGDGRAEGKRGTMAGGSSDTCSPFFPPSQTPAPTPVALAFWVARMVVRAGAR